MLLRRIIHINNICRLALLSFVTRVTFAMIITNAYELINSYEALIFMYICVTTTYVHIYVLI